MAGWLNDISTGASTVLGAVIAFAGVGLAQWLQARQARDARRHESRAAAVARREDFELQYLMEVHGLLRSQAELFERWDAARQLEPFMDSPINDEDVAEDAGKVGTAGAAVRPLVGFILSDEIRGWVSLAVDALMPNDPLREQPGAREAAEQAFDAIAARVREIYAGREAIEPR